MDIKSRRVRVRTKNFSADPLRNSLFLPGRSLVRLGSLTATKTVFPTTYGRYPITEVNTVEAVKNSRDKLQMKECFKRNNIPQAEWFLPGKEPDKVTYPLVAKKIVGFKGHGMFLINNDKEYKESRNKLTNEYFLEHFYNYSREYRLHCNQEICFLSWRKLRKEGVKDRWFFNSLNCNWVGVDHRLYGKPSNWKEIEKVAVEAVRSVGLDIGAVDIRVQSAKHKPPRFIVCEVNSAPALGEQGLEVYREVIKNIILKKQLDGQ